MKKLMCALPLLALGTAYAQTIPDDVPICARRGDIERFANAWVAEDEKVLRKMSSHCIVTNRAMSASILKRDGLYVQVLANTGKDSAPVWTIKDAIR